MDNKEKYLSELHSFIDGVDKEVTMLLQSLQWDRKHLLEGSTLVPCRYDANHRVPPDKKDSHEKACYLRHEGYAKEDQMLPDLFDSNASTVVKLSKEDIQQIIDRAAQADPTFQRGPRNFLSLPLTAQRLQATYTADERRAIHDVVVNNAPDFEHIEDIELTTAEQVQARRNKSKLEVLAELRNMRRRRAKYRGVNTASKNYSNVLRDLITTQMELYTGVPSDSTPQPEPNSSRHSSTVSNHTVQENQKPGEENERNQQRNRDTYQRSEERDRRNNYQQNNKDRYRRDDQNRRSNSQQDNNDRYRRRDEKDHRNNDYNHRSDGYRRNRDTSDKRHRDTERQRKDDDRDKHKYDRRDDYRHRNEVLNKEIKEENSIVDYAHGGEIRIKEEKVSDHEDSSREIRQDTEGNSYENRYRNQHKQMHRNLPSKPRYPDDYSHTRNEHSTDTKYSKDYDRGQSKSLKQYAEESSSKDTLRNRKDSADYKTTDDIKYTNIKRERSRSKTREIDYGESYKDDKYKRYYDMKRALQAEEAKRKKHS